LAHSKLGEMERKSNAMKNVSESHFPNSHPRTRDSQMHAGAVENRSEITFAQRSGFSFI
jgi:hypothetical protein